MLGARRRLGRPPQRLGRAGEAGGPAADASQARRGPRCVVLLPEAAQLLAATAIAGRPLPRAVDPGFRWCPFGHGFRYGQTWRSCCGLGEGGAVENHTDRRRRRKEKRVNIESIPGRSLGQFHERSRASEGTDGEASPSRYIVSFAVPIPVPMPAHVPVPVPVHDDVRRMGVVRAAGGGKKSVAAADGKSVVLPLDGWMHARTHVRPGVRAGWVFAGTAEPTTFLSRSPLSDWADPMALVCHLPCANLGLSTTPSGEYDWKGARELGPLLGLSQLQRVTR